jgi:outer membrane protein TolC
MKRISVLCALLTLYVIGVQAQTVSIEQVLLRVEANNLELQANRQRIDAQKQRIKADNNLPDPTVSYSHTWGEKDKNETIGELIVSQQFDFPTLYAARGKANRLKTGALESEYAALRQQILLQAQSLCIDLLMRQQQLALLDERMRQAEQLEQAYRKRLESGEGNILETNKIKLELLNVRTEQRDAQIAFGNAWNELRILSGDPALTDNEPARYIADTPLPPLPDWAALRDEYVADRPELRMLTAEADAAQKQIAIDKQGWLPKLELGYRRNTESRLGFSGIVAGISLPLFSNRHKVKTAEATWRSLDLQRSNALMEANSELTRLYTEATGLQTSIAEYHDALQAGRSLELLRKALDGGEINITEYFVEVSVIYQSRDNMIGLENRFRKAVATLLRTKL